MDRLLPRDHVSLRALVNGSVRRDTRDHLAPARIIAVLRIGLVGRAALGTSRPSVMTAGHRDGLTVEPGTTVTIPYPGRTSAKTKRHASDDIAAARDHGWHLVNAVWRPGSSRLTRVLVGPPARLVPRNGVLEMTYQFRPTATEVAPSATHRRHPVCPPRGREPPNHPSRTIRPVPPESTAGPDLQADHGADRAPTGPSAGASPPIVAPGGVPSLRAMRGVRRADATRCPQCEPH